jgi:hypothetical protein
VTRSGKLVVHEVKYCNETCAENDCDKHETDCEDWVKINRTVNILRLLFLHYTAVLNANEVMSISEQDNLLKMTVDPADAEPAYGRLLFRPFAQTLPRKDQKNTAALLRGCCDAAAHFVLFFADMMFR